MLKATPNWHEFQSPFTPKNSQWTFFAAAIMSLRLRRFAGVGLTGAGLHRWGPLWLPTSEASKRVSLLLFSRPPAARGSCSAPIGGGHPNITTLSAFIRIRRFLQQSPNAAMQIVLNFPSPKMCYIFRVLSALNCRNLILLQSNCKSGREWEKGST